MYTRIHVVIPATQTSMAALAYVCRSTSTSDAQATSLSSPQLHCPALNLHCAAELLELKLSRFWATLPLSSCICKIPSPPPPPCCQPTSTPLSFTPAPNLLTLLLNTFTLALSLSSLRLTCLAEPLACPPPSRGPRRRIPQRTVSTQSNCPTTSHPPACSRAPLAMTPS